MHEQSDFSPLHPAAAIAPGLAAVLALGVGYLVELPTTTALAQAGCAAMIALAAVAVVRALFRIGHQLYAATAQPDSGTTFRPIDEYPHATSPAAESVSSLAPVASECDGPPTPSARAAGNSPTTQWRIRAVSVRKDADAALLGASAAREFTAMRIASHTRRPTAADIAGNSTGAAANGDEFDARRDYFPLRPMPELIRLIDRQTKRVTTLRAEFRQLAAARRAVRAAARLVCREIDGDLSRADETDAALMALLKVEHVAGLRDGEMRGLRQDLQAIRREANRQHRRAMAGPYHPTTGRTLEAARAALTDWLDDLRDGILDHLRRRSRDVVTQWRDHRDLLVGLKTTLHAMQPATLTGNEFAAAA